MLTKEIRDKPGIEYVYKIIRVCLAIGFQQFVVIIRIRKAFVHFIAKLIQLTPEIQKVLTTYKKLIFYPVVHEHTITLPVANAVITVDGVATEYKTDAEGKVTLKLSEAGEYVISATSAEATLVPPAVVVTVEASSPATGDSAVAIIAILLSVSALGAFVATRKRNEI